MSFARARLGIGRIPTEQLVDNLKKIGEYVATLKYKND